ncbi:MAG: response regulator RpfG family c-di-GMP phosphodiesterase [Polaribacter sp.]|jgi:response regulator RpfG family c-di-GMP phosphodiesterase
MAVKKKLNLIISGILMSKMNGFEMLTKLQKKVKIKSIPLTFLSAKVKKKDIRAAMHPEDEDYLKKLINMNDLIRAVKKRLLI